MTLYYIESADISCKEVMTVNGNIFEQAAEYARFHDPVGMNVLIASAERLPDILREIAGALRLPVLYVTGTGYVPFATKTEIIRRGTANLLLLGGEESISEWVAYVLSTFTKGRVYRILGA
jgi:hypothetical protein